MKHMRASHIGGAEYGLLAKAWKPRSGETPFLFDEGISQSAATPCLGLQCSILVSLRYTASRLHGRSVVKRSKFWR